MLDIRLRAPSEGDWPELLELANRSVADVHGATTQEAWVTNRQTFRGERQHWVAEDSATGRIVGYAAVERPVAEPGVRMFVVTEPVLRADVGDRLLSLALDEARTYGAPSAWLIEYAGDSAFLAFLEARGFREARRFALPDGAEACVMAMRLHRRTSRT